MVKITEVLSRPPFAVVGHRGAAGLGPENTIRSIKKAISLGVDAVEVDVRATRDSRLILIHDEDFTRVSGVKARVHDLTIDEVRRGIKVRGEAVPTLEEVLRVVDGVAGVFIDFKEEALGHVASLVDVIDRVGAWEWVVVTSFRDYVVSRVRELDPRLGVGISYQKPPVKVLECKKIGCCVLLPHYKLATRRTVELAHKTGVRVAVWTVNSVETARGLAARGVDAIMSDKPDLIVGLRDGWGGRTLY